MKAEQLAMVRTWHEILMSFRNSASMATELLDRGHALEASMLTSKMIEVCDESLEVTQSMIKRLTED